MSTRAARRTRTIRPGSTARCGQWTRCWPLTSASRRPDLFHFRRGRRSHGRRVHERRHRARILLHHDHLRPALLAALDRPAQRAAEIIWRVHEIRLGAESLGDLYEVGIAELVVVVPDIRIGW